MTHKDVSHFFCRLSTLLSTSPASCWRITSWMVDFYRSDSISWNGTISPMTLRMISRSGTHQSPANICYRLLGFAISTKRYTIKELSTSISKTSVLFLIFWLVHGKRFAGNFRFEFYKWSTRRKEICLDFYFGFYKWRTRRNRHRKILD